jgi:hypothetical protein
MCVATRKMHSCTSSFEAAAGVFGTFAVHHACLTAVLNVPANHTNGHICCSGVWVSG